jgi:hypothetical protein
VPVGSLKHAASLQAGELAARVPGPRSAADDQQTNDEDEDDELEGDA